MRAQTIAVLLLTSCMCACTSRTLPLPPPEVQEVSAPDADGLVLVRGLALEAAGVGVMNDMDGTGVIVTSPQTGCDSSCPFEARIPAQSGDPLRLWQFFETPSTTHADVP